MKSDSADWSWSTDVVYACACGTHFGVKRWRWIDASARSQLAQRARRRGPLEGLCPECGRQASAPMSWVSIDSRRQQAALIVGDIHRADLPRLLREHLEAIERRPEWASAWLLQPPIEFAMSGAALDEEDTNPGRPAPKARAVPVARERPKSEPVAAAPVAAAPPQEHDFAAEIDEAAFADAAAELAAEGFDEAELVAVEDVGAVVSVVAADPLQALIEPAPLTETLGGDLALRAGNIRVTAAMSPQTGEFWRTADVKARPVLLREYGYPLVGVRVVAEALGRRSVIDAMRDVAEEDSVQLFIQLANQFHVQLALVDERGAPFDERLINGEGLERNVAMCLESARGIVNKGAFSGKAFEQALKRLAAEPLDKRLTPAKYPVEVVDTIELASAARVWEALDFLNDLSKKENLTHLLEVEGLSVTAYENLRRRVLVASLGFGLTPPTRFWRRVLGSDIVGTAEDWVTRLVAARHAAIKNGTDDLSPVQVGEAWHRIRDLCHRKRVAEPAALSAVFATDSGKAPVMRMRRSTQPPVSASGEIGGDDSSPKSARAPSKSKTKVKVKAKANRGEELQDPKHRLSRATDILSGAVVSPQSLGLVLDALEEFDVSELLAILPNLTELGNKVVPGLIDKLSGSRRELRQAAAIILGMTGDRRAVEPLIRRLVDEQTSVWIDVARALGGYGPRVIGPLCDLLQDTPARDRDRLVKRVARAMAEVVVSDGDDEGGPGRVAVEALVDVGDPALSGSAREALATLNAVRNAGEMARGERPLDEDTVVRGFSRLAYEAITVPEVDMSDFEVLGG